MARCVEASCIWHRHHDLTRGALVVAVSQVLPTQLIPDEKEGKVLRVRFIQKEGVKFFDPAYLFDGMFDLWTLRYAM